MTTPRLPALARIWGRPRHTGAERARSALVDVILVAALAGLLYGLGQVGGEWTDQLRPTVEIDLGAAALPRYAFFSFSRGLFAYVLSLGFSLVYGYWAAKDRVAERVLVPLLDVLQSIPVLGFMPGLVLALVAIFPRSNVGLEMAAVLMIFTGQVWNLTFSFYHSLRAVPREQREVATLYGFGWWRTFRHVELPFATTGLVWNSMMSVAGGWFFLMINEAFVLGDKDFRLPGLGSYMSVAAARGDGRAMVSAMVAMVIMIVVLDQLVFRPLVVWAQKFRMEEGGHQDAMSSWFYDVVRRSRLLPWIAGLLGRARSLVARPAAVRAPPAPAPTPARHDVPAMVSRVVFAALLLGLALGAWRLLQLFRAVTPAAWLSLGGRGLLTLGRVVVATVVGTLWALPAGVAVGLSPRLSRLVQPVAQVLASFPAPMLFPAVIALLHAAGVSLGWGSILLMLLGTQWYIFFNVIAGAVAVPADLREAAASYHFSLWYRLRAVYLPSVFPYLVTGWVTAAGGAWNASIVAEYVTFKGRVLTAPGLGAAISDAAERADLSRLAAAVTVMSAIVVVFNRVVWHTLYRVAEDRFSVDK
jgi:NitT/TauT family transport system permease protein